MADSTPIHRNMLPEAIEKLLDATGATHVTLTLTEADVRIMARDIRWTRKTTINYYYCAELNGEIRK